mgnify:CR=1 FL=1
MTLLETRFSWLPDFLQEEYENGDTAYKIKADKALIQTPFTVDMYCIAISADE